MKRLREWWAKRWKLRCAPDPHDAAARAAHEQRKADLEARRRDVEERLSVLEHQFRVQGRLGGEIQ